LFSDAHIKVLGNTETIGSHSYVQVADITETITSDAWILFETPQTINSDAMVQVDGSSGGVPDDDENTNPPDNETQLPTFYCDSSPYAGVIDRIDLNMRAEDTAQSTRLIINVAGTDYPSDYVTVNTGPHATYTFNIPGRPRIEVGDAISITKEHSGIVYYQISTQGDDSPWAWHFWDGPIIHIYFLKDIQSDMNIFKEAEDLMTSDMVIAESGQWSPDGPTYFFVEEEENLDSDAVIVEFGVRDILMDAYIKKLGTTQTIESGGEIEKIATVPFVIQANSSIKPKIIYADVDLSYTRR
jgi:hypothetical protein